MTSDRANPFGLLSGEEIVKVLHPSSQSNAHRETLLVDHGLELQRVSDIVAQPVRWLWPGRIARGKVTILAGHPGLGKSQLGVAIVAIATTGGQWPVDGKRAERASAVILSAEDDPADTIRPRLEAAGADLNRCHIIGAVRERNEDSRERRRGFSLVHDVPRLAKALSEIPDCVLVIIDPITAYLGATDSHRNAEVRAVLAPLAELTAQHGVAALAISHLRKSLAGDAVLQVTGSLAFAAAARAVYIVARDPDNPERRLFLSAKNNLGDDRTGYAYRIDPVSLANGIDTSRIIWEPQLVTITADEALAARDRERGTPAAKQHSAARWLARMLAEGPVAVGTLKTEAEAAGYSWATVRRAHDALGVTAEKIAFAGGWAWRLREEAAAGEEIEL